MKTKLETDRLILREYEKTDVKAVHDYASREDILIYESWGPNNQQDSEKFIAEVIALQNQQPRTGFELAVTLKENGRLIGGCGFRFDKTDHKRGKIGYIIHPDYWRNGYASEAAQALVDHFGQHHSLEYIEATCDELNLASQRVLENCGFKKAGHIQKHFEMKGRMRGTYLYKRVVKATI
jgi:RimJ/RimL family protein N-acetyltransferase